MSQVEIITKVLNHRKNQNQEKIDRFAEKYQESPVEAFSWAKDDMEAAAENQVINKVLDALKKENADVNHIKNYLLENLVSKAKSVESSTSPVSNLQERYVLASYAKVYEYFKEE